MTGLKISSKPTIIYVIYNNGSFNKNKKIEEYLKISRIKIYYLLPYLTTLNPIELI